MNLTVAPRSLELIADGCSFLEGPRWHRGALFVSDFYTHEVLRFDSGGRHVVCEVAHGCVIPVSEEEHHHSH